MGRNGECGRSPDNFATRGHYGARPAGRKGAPGVSCKVLFAYLCTVTVRI